jgi:3-hydroxyisobutyrate dehydrogenase
MTTTQPTAQHITPAHLGHSQRTATPAIAFLGTGRMGGPMAANLARSGFAVRVWNRTASRAAALTKDGAAVASSPAEAIHGAGILITMLADGPATEQAATKPDGLLAAAPGLIWVQMATVGME